MGGKNKATLPLVILFPQAATIASQLLVAVRTRDLRSIRRLCSTKSDQLTEAIKRRDGQGHTLMHWAAKAGDVEMLELLAGEFFVFAVV